MSNKLYQDIPDNSRFPIYILIGTRCSPDRLCIADATGPCMVASAVFGLPICDAAKGTSATCAFDVVEPGTFREANTACETAETICWTVASVRLVVAGLRTGRTSAGFDEDGRSSTVALFSAGFDLVARRREKVVVKAFDWARHCISITLVDIFDKLSEIIIATTGKFQLS